MKRDRFTLILRFLHLNDSSLYIKKGQPGHDPLYTLRPFIQRLFSNFQGNYILSKEVSVDEMMIGFKGRLSFIQYMPKKPTKWGMKAYVLADSRTGYMYNWYLYTHMHWTFTCTFPLHNVQVGECAYTMYMDDVCMCVHVHVTHHNTVCVYIVCTLVYNMHMHTHSYTHIYLCVCTSVCVRICIYNVHG